MKKNGSLLILAIVVIALLVFVLVASPSQLVQEQVLPDGLVYKTVRHSFFYVFSNSSYLVVDKNGREYEVNYSFWKSLAIPEK